MTTELEQEFFKTFGVDKICTHAIINPEACNHRRMTRCCGCDWLDYPEITDRKLLEMICINSYFCGVNFHNLWVKNPDEIKAIILDEIIRWYKEQKYGHEECKHQIQQVFEGEE